MDVPDPIRSQALKGLLQYFSFILHSFIGPRLGGYPFCAGTVLGQGVGRSKPQRYGPFVMERLHSTLLGTQKGTDCGLDHQIL